MKQFIQCPDSGKVELGTIDTSTWPWNTLIHNCSCGYTIMESEWDQVKALSIKQPWAWLIVNGYKSLENRNTLKNFTGDFLIHAGSKFDHKWKDKIHSDLVPLLEHFLLFPYIYKLTHQGGGIIGYATITDSITESDSPWFSGPNAFVIKNPKPLPFTPCKGKLSFFYPEID